MKKVFIIFLLFFSFFSRAQNLVLNGNFEYYSSCPTSPGQINLSFPWYDPTGASSDYFNACSLFGSLVSVPNQTNSIFQSAKSGVAYAGFSATKNDGNNYREYIQTQFTEPMVAGKCYKISFYVNLYNQLRFGCNNIGAYISQTAITAPPEGMLNYSPQILLIGNPAIIDTINWVEISGIYTANGGENYITIGNFSDDGNTTYQLVDSSNAFNDCYYYIDDVSVTECDTSSGINETQKDYGINMYPNPNNGKMTVEYHLAENENAQLTIYNVTGKLMKRVPLNSKATVLNLDETSLQAGMYYYSITVNNKVVKTEKLIIIK